MKTFEQGCLLMLLAVGINKPHLWGFCEAKQFDLFSY